ncbi:MAG: hypothetical protein M3Q39_14415 [Actinomycetota bacterium]|nr:hypothetical protein [Actinomycetota bacterium]
MAGTADDRRAALAALVEACIAASGMARPLGRGELSASATRRGYDAPRRLEDPTLTGFAAMRHTSSLTRIGAARRATAVRTEALAALGEAGQPTAPAPLPQG